MDFKNPYLLLLAVPGFIALFAANFVSDFPAIRDSQLPFVYFIFSILSLAPPLCIVWGWLYLSGRSTSLKSVLGNASFIISTALFSLALGLSVGMLHTNDIVSNALRDVFGKNLVPIYSHDELVRELFSRMDSPQFLDGRFSSEASDSGGILPRDPFGLSSNRYARISLQNVDVTYEGKVIAFHSGTDTPQVYLSPACRMSPDGNISVVQGSGVWLSLESVNFVEIIDDVCSACATRHEELNGRVGGENCPYNQ
jgi:hypothetical protein